MNFTIVQNDNKEGNSRFSDSAEHYSYRADAVLVKPELSAITAPDSIKTFSDPLRARAVSALAARGTRRTSESIRHRRHFREELLLSLGHDCCINVCGPTGSVPKK